MAMGRTPENNSPPSRGLSKEAKNDYVEAVQDRISTLTSVPNSLVIFTDGSRRRVQDHRRTGAGYVAYTLGREVRSGQWGMGRRAEVYDAEMLALAGAAMFAADYVRSHAGISSIIFFSDNQAVSSITNTTNHPAQYMSILFRT